MSDEIVSVQGVSRWFGVKLALANVSLGIPRGIVFGLVGENGAGKTTLIKHLLGLYQVQGGRLRVRRGPGSRPAGRAGTHRLSSSCRPAATA